MDDRQYWLGFSLVSEIGPKRLANLLRHFNSIEGAWKASEKQLSAIGLDQRAIHNLSIQRQQLNLDSELSKIAQLGAQLITLADDDYPPLLKQLDDPPLVLYVRGRLAPEDQRALAVVGTRRATTYGRTVAHRLSKELAAQGITIISGLAHGIDSAAHQGALDGGGRTLAVLGNGIDQIYPRDQVKLAEQIMRCGALISEFPLGMPPDKRNFPRRNRVISGLALGVLVAEAPENSGALITTETASAQGREVFAVPGNILNPMSRGSNRLIQDGAKLVIDVRDILDEFNITYTNTQTRTKTERLVPDNPVEVQILAALQTDPIHIDDLVRTLGLPVHLISGTLTILELKGLAQSSGNMQYSLTIN